MEEKIKAALRKEWREGVRKSSLSKLDEIYDILFKITLWKHEKNLRA